MIPRSLASPCPHCPLAAESSRRGGIVGRKKRRLAGNRALCDYALRSAGPVSVMGSSPLGPGPVAPGFGLKPAADPQDLTRPAGSADLT